MVLAIRTVDELSALRLRSARRRVEGVALELIAHPKLRARLEAPINRHVASCGCGTGAAFVAVGLIALITAAFQLPGSIGFVRIAQALGILLALGLVGKVIGLLGAEYKLRGAIDAALNALQRDAVPRSTGSPAETSPSNTAD